MNAQSGGTLNVTDMVYERLFKDIILHNYKPGDRIPSENYLAECYNVSRNTVRMALNKLNVLGVLETRRGDGTFVRKIGMNMYLNSFIPAVLINEESLMDLMEFRKGIEVAAVRLAARNATEDNIRRIEESLDVSNAAFAKKDPVGASIMAFHSEVVNASGNQLFIMMFEIVVYILTSKMADFLVYQKFNMDSPFFHSVIFEAIRNRKADEAAYLMERHMLELLQKVEEFNQYSMKHSQPDSPDAG